MIDVACFCGCCFSLLSEVGVCPECGELVSPIPMSAEVERQMREELELLLSNAADKGTTHRDRAVRSDLRAFEHRVFDARGSR